MCLIRGVTGGDGVGVTVLVAPPPGAAVAPVLGAGVVPGVAVAEGGAPFALPHAEPERWAVDIGVARDDRAPLAPPLPAVEGAEPPVPVPAPPPAPPLVGSGGMLDPIAAPNGGEVGGVTTRIGGGVASVIHTHYLITPHTTMHRTHRLSRPIHDGHTNTRCDKRLGLLFLCLTSHA